MYEKMPKLLRKYFLPRDMLVLRDVTRKDPAVDSNVFDLGGDPGQDLHDAYIYQRDTIARIKAERRAGADVGVSSITSAADSPGKLVKSGLVSAKAFSGVTSMTSASKDRGSAEPKPEEQSSSQLAQRTSVVSFAKHTASAAPMASSSTVMPNATDGVAEVT